MAGLKGVGNLSMASGMGSLADFVGTGGEMSARLSGQTPAKNLAASLPAESYNMINSVPGLSQDLAGRFGLPYQLAQNYMAQRAAGTLPALPAPQYTGVPFSPQIMT